MLTRPQILAQVKDRDEILDGRDLQRLASFFPKKNISMFGMEIKDSKVPWKARPWTEKEVMKQLTHDLDFAFEKALDQRGISAGLMHSVILMWMWVLEDPLQHDEDYAQYGLPLFKKVAVKYGLPNEIGDDVGDENKYAAC